MSAQFTPGPWKAVSVEGGWDGVAEATGSRATICRLALNTPANALLIAAAPALLEACQLLVADYEDANSAIGDDWYRKAKAAIAKATGAAA